MNTYTLLDLDIILLKTISMILPLVDIFKNAVLKAWKCQYYGYFLVYECQSMKYSNLQNITLISDEPIIT